jgi:hypothetical protein
MLPWPASAGAGSSWLPAAMLPMNPCAVRYQHINHRIGAELVSSCAGGSLSYSLPAETILSMRVDSAGVPACACTRIGRSFVWAALADAGKDTSRLLKKAS